MKIIFTFINKYLTPILLIFLVYTSYQLYNQNNIQTSRIDTLNKTLYDIADDRPEIYKEIKQTQFKEDYYLNQLSNSTTLIMTMIAIVVTLGGLITYKTFDDKVANSEEELKKQILKINNLSKDLETQNEELKLRINNTLVTSTLAYFSIVTESTSNKLVELSLITNHIQSINKFEKVKIIELFIKTHTILNSLNSLTNIATALDANNQNNPITDLQEAHNSNANLIQNTLLIIDEVKKILQKTIQHNNKKETQTLCKKFLLDKTNNLNQEIADITLSFNNIFDT